MTQSHSRNLSNQMKSAKSKKQSLYIVGTNGLPVRYGGWDMLLHHLTLSLAPEYDIYVYTSTYDSVIDVKVHNGATIKLVPLRANGIQSIPYDFLTTLDACLRGADKILVLGVSGGLFFPLFKFFRSSIILNPDGAEWKRSKFNAISKSFLKLSEKLGVKYADRVISDSAVIRAELRSYYGVESDIIEYGGDHVDTLPLSHSTRDLYDLECNQYAFKVCRIVPENNIEMILRAFALSGLTLVLIGNWKNSEFGVATRNKFASFSNLRLLDPIYEQRELDELRGNCRVYIHGHSVGGTNPSLVEAMHLALPCLVYDVSYNRETTEGRAVFFDSEEAIISSVEKLWENDTALRALGSSLREVAAAKYCWEDIIKKYRDVISRDD